MHKLGCLLIFLAAAGCVETGKPHQPHEKPRLEKTTPPRAEVPTGSADPLMREHGFAGDINLISQLSAEILRPEIMDSPEDWHRLDVARKLRRLNDELVAALRGNLMVDRTVGDAVGRYEATALKGCLGFQKQCPSLAFFKQASNSSDVAQLLADRRRDSLDIYYQLIFFAFEVKGRDHDVQLNRRFIVESKDYLELLKAKDVARARQFANMVSVVSQRLVAIGDPRIARELVETLDLLNPAERTKLIQLGVPGDVLVHLIGLAGSLSETTANAGPRDHVMKAHFAKPTGIEAVQKNLIAGHASMMRQLQIERLDRFDGPVYALDLAFLGEITTDQGISLIRSLRPDRSQMAATIKRVLMIRFLEALAKSTDEAQRKFFEKEVSSQNFFFHALESATDVRPIWGTFNSRANQLQKLAMVVLATSDPQDRLVRDTKSLFGGIPANIKYISSYPTMMALAYHMSKREAKITFQSAWGGTREIESGTVIESLFMGQYEPWFDYSEDALPLNFVEMLYSFDFALRTGVFQRFEIEPDVFAREIVERLGRRAIRGTSDYLRLLESRLAGSNFREFRNVCAGIERNQVPVRITLKDLKSSPVLGKLGWQVYTSISNRSSANSNTLDSKEVEKIVSGIMIFDDTFSGSAEEVRLDLDNILRWMEALTTSYRHYLQQAEPAKVEEKVKVLRESMDRIQGFRVKFMSKTAKLFREIDPCYSKIARFEEDVKLQLTKMEEAHLRQVHADITRLRAKELTVQQIRARHQFTGLPSGFKGLDDYSTDSYFYNQIDAFIRLGNYLTKGQNTDQVKFPPAVPGAEVNFGGRLDLETDELKDSVQIRISYMADVEKFVQQGLWAYFHRPGFVNWLEIGAGRIHGWQERLHAAVIMNRLSDPILLGEICKTAGACGAGGEIVSAKEILAIHLQMLDLIKIEGDRRRLLGIVGTGRRVDPLSLARLTLDYDILNAIIIGPWGVLDLPVYIMTREVLGTTFSIQEMAKMSGTLDAVLSIMAGWERYRHISYRDIAKKYYQIRRRETRSQIFFPINKAMDGLIENGIRGLVRRETGKIASFAAEVGALLKDIENSPAAARPRSDIDINESVTSPMLSSHLLDNYTKDLKTFNKDTGECYVNDSCPDFAGQ